MRGALRSCVLLAGLHFLCACTIDKTELQARADRDRSSDGGSSWLDAAARPDAPPNLPPIETCFASGTPIAVPGGARAIETFEVGDAVWAYDTARGARVRSWVTAVHHHRATAVGRLRLPLGDALLVTGNHPIYSPQEDRYVPAGELSSAHAVLRLDRDDGAARTLLVPAFEANVTHAPVHNLTVAGVHNYFAAGVLVHNKQPPPCPQYNWVTGLGCGPLDACFAAGTPIATPTGERAIETLAVGDRVWAFDTATGVRVESKVSDVHRHAARALGQVKLQDGRLLHVTDNHPIFVLDRDAYVPAGDLAVGQQLLGLHDHGVQLLAASAFEPETAYAPVYNITVAGMHNYFATGVLVHNKQPPPCPTYNWSTREGCDHPSTGTGPACEAYPAELLDGEAYALRVSEYLALMPFAPGTFSDPTDGTARNPVLLALFAPERAGDVGRALSRWLRVPVPAAASAAGDLDQQLAYQLMQDLGMRVTQTSGATLADLLTYAEGSFTPMLATFYGIESFDEQTDSPRPASFPASHTGLLTEGAFLRAHDTPSARGRALAEVLLCGDFLPHAPPMLPPLQLGTRYSAYAALSQNGSCSACHAELDGIGLALEHFDALGRYRPTEAGQAITGAGQLQGTAIEGAAGLASALLAHPMLSECVARSLLEDAVKRPLQSADECSVQWVLDGMQDPLDMRAAMLSVITSPAFLHAAP